MNIVCKIIREGGSKVEVPGGERTRTYHFKPSANAPELHVAEVEDEAHIATLLGISEAYVALDNVDDPVPEPEAIEPAAETPVAKWSNKKTFAYAKQVLGMTVPEDKKAIDDIAERHGLKLDARKGAAPMLRELIAHIGVQEDEDNAE